MAFEEWLSLGGNELINNARTVGYALTADCPMGWFKGDICPTLAAATFAVANYHNDQIEAAPWYDPVLDSISRRFYGAFGVSITGIEDSTRTAGVTQGLADGGVIGRVRKAPREVKVQVILAGEGQDALEYGMAWLSAALDPNACGQHGDACGTADLTYFSSCPPARRRVPVYSSPVVTTNLATNPSMETPGAVTEIRHNLIENPRMRTVTGWTGQEATITGTEYGMQVDVPTDEASGSLLFHTSAPWAPGVMAAGSMDFEVPPEYPAVTVGISIEFRDAASSLGQLPGPAMTIQPGERFRLTTAIGAAPAGTTLARLLIYTRGPVAAGSRFVTRNALLEQQGKHLPYFDGSTDGGGSSPFDYAWDGAVDASPSTQYGKDAAGWTPSELRYAFRAQTPEARPSVGDWAVRAVSRADAMGDIRWGGSGTLEAGKTYTVSADLYLPRPHVESIETPESRQRRILVFFNGGETFSHGPQAPNEFGWHRLEHSFTVPAGGTAIVGLGSGGSPQDDYFDSIWDAVTIIEGPPSQVGYFDGDTEDTDLATYEWTGTPHDSTSTSSVIHLVGDEPEPLSTYRDEVAKVTRYLHDVAAISGPLIQQQVKSGPHWAYMVEYTLVAGNPYVFGAMREIELPPRMPVVVQDIPYNLVPYPSAEQSAGTVVVATNYATNPSVETDTTGWGTAASTPGWALSRSTELASVGAASAKTLLTTTVDGANGSLWIQHDQIPLPGITAESRYSVNLWASASVESGTAVLGEIQYAAIWVDGAGGQMGVTHFGTNPPGGGAQSVKSVLPPAGTVGVIVRATLTIPSWSNGAKIRLYADAVAVTVP